MPTLRPDLNHRPPEYRLGATLGGQTWRGQLRGEFYQYYYYLLYQHVVIENLFLSVNLPFLENLTLLK